jgi:2-desacetyl-2-hydroxyethyl bacteriochlorophyllide A dehydrogenase
MRAAQLTDFNQTLKLTDIELPSIAADEVLVEIEVCGVCHTDVAIRNGSLPTTSPPFVPGHEPMGTVAEVGTDVESVSEDDRVAVDPLVTCGDCYYCRRGEDDLCEQWRNAAGSFGTIGRDRNGGFAEFTAAPAKNLIKLPPSISAPVGAILMDAGATSFNSVQHADFEIGDTAVVFGIGGVGICALKYLNLVNHINVVAVDINERKLSFAEGLGVTQTINAREEDPLDIINSITNGRGADYCFEFSGASSAMETAALSLRPNGTAIITGCAEESWSIPGDKCCFDAINITGTHGFTHSQLHQIVELVSSGTVSFEDLITHRHSLEDINTAIDRLESSENDEELIGRAVVQL